MTRITEEEKRRWIAALARRIRGRVAATVRSGRVRAEAADPPPRDLPPAAKEER